jgi:DNA modification methylase
VSLLNSPVRCSTLGSISVSALDSVQRARHRWYFVKEAFSPDIVTHAAKDAECSPKDLIVDPFCGSGTVILQSALDGHRAAGIEVNPFLAFVAKAKLQQCKPALLKESADIAATGASRKRKSHLTDFSTFSEKDGATSWLFNREVLDAFEGAWQAIDVPQRSAPTQHLIKLCLIGAAMDVCNAFKDGKCLRYRKDWEELAYDGEDFIAALESRVKIVAEDLNDAPLGQTLVTLIRGDARTRPLGGPFRLCVTSPPYLNSFDYTDVYRPELFLGRWVRDMKGLRALRLRTIRSHVQVRWKDPTANDFGAHYTDSMAAILPHSRQLWNSRIPLMIQAYFEDMRRVLQNLRSVAHKHASVWIVVSTSSYAGIEIPVDLILADIGSSCGWYLREVQVLRYLNRLACQQWSELAEKKAGGPHLRESLVILDARPKGRSCAAVQRP